jgi:hypothetical protein
MSEAHNHSHMGGRRSQAAEDFCGVLACCHRIRNGRTIICAAVYAWALSTTAIDAHTAETLLVVGVAAMEQAADKPAVRKLLADGVGRLDSARVCLGSIEQRRPRRRAQEHGGQRVLHDYSSGHHQQRLHQPLGLSLLRLRRIISRRRRLHMPGFRRHRLAAELVIGGPDMSKIFELKDDSVVVVITLEPAAALCRTN